MLGERGLGKRELRRGEIRWYTFRHPDKRRPVLILTRNEIIERLNEIIVVPATRTIRGLATELILTLDDGMPVACALNFDHVALAQRERIGAVLSYLPQDRWPAAQARTSPGLWLRSRRSANVTRRVLRGGGPGLRLT